MASPSGASIYSQLLALSYRERGDYKELTETQLLETLDGRRAALQALAFDDGPPVAADAIATQLGYDLVLLELCQRRQIPCDPAAFYQPVAERGRLEAALVEAGVPLGPLADQ